jgi:hypothetical protein
VVLFPDGTVHPLTPERRNQGLVFDSLKECRRWIELCKMQREGKISHLRRQLRIRIPVRNERGEVTIVCAYVADYVYLERGAQVVEDCKSPITKKLPVYVLKRRLLRAALGIEIRET